MLLAGFLAWMPTTSLCRAQAPWEKASHSYNTALKVYKLGDWKKAKAAFEEFLETYPGNEHVPLAYLQLAHCRGILKDWQGREEAVETVIEKFPDSKAAKYAWGHRLSVLRGQKKYDEWLDRVEALLKRYKYMPFNFSGRLDWRRNGDYWWRFNHTTLHFPHARASGYRLNIAPGIGWAGRVLQVADTPARALRALVLLEPTFKEYGMDLPVNWKYVHIELLRRAAEFKPDPEQKGAMAKKLEFWSKRKRPTPEEQTKEYFEGWPEDDPRRMGLMWLMGHYAQTRGEEKQAQAWYDKLMEKYPRYSTLGNRLVHRLKFLYGKQRYSEFAVLADWYLKHYPIGHLRDNIVDWWVELVKKQGKAGAKNVPVVLKLLDDEEQRYANNPRRLKKGIRQRIELYQATEQLDEAVAQAEKLLSKPFWCSESFRYVEELAKKHKPFQPILDAARKRYVIAVEDLKSPAKKRYDELQQRIKADQTRHMEEIGTELLDAHPKDAWTIKAINDLVNYYYSKVLIEPRDRWVGVMQEHYPRHPLTQEVIDRQFKAVEGAKNYQALAPVAEWAMQHFPGSDRWDAWMNGRLACFSALKDYAGGQQYVRKAFGPRAKTGELHAIAKVVEWDSAAPKEGEDWLRVRGNRWLQEADRWEGRAEELYCLQNAFDHFYDTPVRHWWWNRICFPEASQTAKRLRESKYDPELAWRLKYEPVNMLIQSGQAVAAAQEAMKIIKDVKQTFQLNQRLDLYNLGWTLGQAKLSGKAHPLLRALMNRCKTRSDQYVFKIMLGNMFEAEGNHTMGAKFYTMAANDLPWAIDQWPLQIQAAGGLNPAGYTSTLSKYGSKIKTAQDVIPRILYWIGNKNLGNPRSRSMLSVLRQSFPHSGYRGALEKKMHKK